MSDELIDDPQAAEAEPAAERVTLALVEAVGTIAQVTGYWDDVIVTRPSPAEPRPTKHAAIEIDLDTETKEDAPTNVEQIRARHLVRCEVVSPPERRDTSIDSLIHRIKADVKRAVMRAYAKRGTALWRVAMEVTFGDAELLATDESAHMGAVLLYVDVVYRTLEDDPYVLLTNAV